MSLDKIWIKNAKLLPVQQIIPYVRGGLIAPGYMPQKFRHQRYYGVFEESIAFDEANADFIAGDYVYGGPFSSHFGHMVAEFSHRLWVPEARKFPVIFCARQGDSYIQPHFEQIMSYLGIENVKFVHAPTIAENLLVPEQGTGQAQMTGKLYARFLQRRADIKQLRRPNMPEKIALLRDHFGIRRVAGEANVRQLLEEEGYTIYRPEAHPLEDQLATLFNAKKIVIADGSTAHLFDLLPRINAQVFLFGRKRRSLLGQTSVAPKVEKFVEDLRAFNLIAPAMKSGRRSPNRSLLGFPLSELTASMKAAGFVSTTLPDISPDQMASEIRSYLSPGMPGMAEGIKPDDVALNEMVIALSGLHTKFQRLKSRRGWKALQGYISKKLR